MTRRALLLTIVMALAAALPTRAGEVPKSFWKWEKPTVAEAVPLATALGLMWIDVLQTRAFMRQGIPDWNPALRGMPSPGRAFWVGGILPSVLLTGTWLVLPAGWRMLPAAAVTGIEAEAVAHNAGLTTR